MMVNVLITTIDSGIANLEDLFVEPKPDVRYIVSHQVTDQAFKAVPAGLDGEDIVVGQISGRGLSRNRNNALAMADGDIAILADDDARYLPEYLDTVKRIFEADESLDVACFKIATPEDQPEYKAYHESAYLLSEEEHHYISSLEIAFRLSPIKSRGLAFDERFGLGSGLISYGEEAVFIYDCIKAGLKVKYIPEYIVEHSAESATRALAEYCADKNIFKGAYDARRYGWLAFPAAFYRTLQLWKDLRRNRVSPLRYLRECLLGASYIYST